MITRINSNDLLPTPRPFSACVGILMAVLLCVAGAASSQAAGAAAIPGYVAVPLKRSGNDLVIETRINGHTTHLILDTGAATTVLSQSAYAYAVPPGAEANLPAGIPHKSTFNGRPGIHGWLADFRAGEMNFGSGPVGVTDLYGLRQGAVAAGREHARLEGLFGADLLVRYGAIIDPSRQVVYFNTDPAHKVHLGPMLVQSGWTAIPMDQSSRRHFAVPVTVDNHTFNMIVDTGAPATAMDRDLIDGLKMSTSQTNYYGGVLNTKIERVRSARLKDWKIGDFKIDSFPVGVQHLPEALLNTRTSGGATLGLLGADVLLIYHSMIDVGGGKLYLHPY